MSTQPSKIIPLVDALRERQQQLRDLIDAVWHLASQCDGYRLDDPQISDLLTTIARDLSDGDFVSASLLTQLLVDRHGWNHPEFRGLPLLIEDADMAANPDPEVQS